MHPPRLTIPSLLLIAGLAGCSSMPGLKRQNTAPATSIAVVGDRVLPAKSGEPGDQIAAESAEPEPKRNPKARISGRVIDDHGQPVPDAIVRLADGGQSGGRDSRTTTDRSGAFTLGGLRIGSDYVIVAESEADGSLQTGRARAKTSDTGVTINLGTEDDSTATRRPGLRSPRARPISSREDGGDPADEMTTTRHNREDLEPPAAEASGDEDFTPRRNATSGTAQLSAPVTSAAGWRKGGGPAALADRDGQESDPTTGSNLDDPVPRARRPAAEAPLDEDGPDPLPPAIELPGTAPRASLPGRPRRDPGDLRLAVEPKSARRSKVAKVIESGGLVGDSTGGMLPMPSITPDEPPSEASSLTATAGPATSLEPDPISPQDGSSPSTGTNLVIGGVDRPPTRSAKAHPPSIQFGQDPPKPNPAPGPVFASQGVVNGASEPEPDAPYDPFALVAATSNQPAPPVESRRAAALGDPLEPTDAPAAAEAVAASAPAKKWGDLAAGDRPPLIVEPTKAPSSLLRRVRSPVSTASKASTALLCDYDSKHRKINNFQLPDLEGKPVRLHDLDADYVLLDFWGTWCGPCLDSIPHLIDLQKKYGPSKLRVVGIACEKTPEAGRAARVGEFTQKLGINYTVLLSNMDGSCPVQNALQVQFYPTMVLLDRKGQILWRDRGATPATLERLDRVLVTKSRDNLARR